MLKRNGENCEHPVPDYPGLLTTTEHHAYQTVFPLVAGPVSQHNERAEILAEIESQAPQIAEAVAAQKNVLLTGAWQLRHVLFPTGDGGDMVICSCGVNGREQFGVIQRFDPNSAYARAHGDSMEITRGDHVLPLLKNLVELERAVLELHRSDITAIVDEKLAELFPKLDARRVVRAIAARCPNQAAAQSEREAPAKSIKIRM